MYHVTALQLCLLCLGSAWIGATVGILAVCLCVVGKSSYDAE